jgi:hypothetical protein
MRHRRVPEAYVLFAEKMIRAQELVRVMLLYIFCNADLLDIPEYRAEAALGYVSDTLLFAEGKNLKAMLTDMIGTPRSTMRKAASNTTASLGSTILS